MDKSNCRHCESGEPLDLDFTFAFQPIIQWSTRGIFAYEALVRGSDGSGAASVLSQIADEKMYTFDQTVRARAVALAAPLFDSTDAFLSINIMPNAVYEPQRCIRATLQAAREHGFPSNRLMFELTEHERVVDPQHVKRIIQHYASLGFTTAIDDFGSGFSNLKLLTEFLPHLVKLDRELLRGVDSDPVRRTILGSLRAMTDALGIRVVAEGVETLDEFATLLDLGFDIFQGFLFAKPGFEHLPHVDFDAYADVLPPRYLLPRPSRVAA